MSSDICMFAVFRRSLLDTRTSFTNYRRWLTKNNSSTFCGYRKLQDLQSLTPKEQLFYIMWLSEAVRSTVIDSQRIALLLWTTIVDSKRATPSLNCSHWLSKNNYCTFRGYQFSILLPRRTPSDVDLPTGSEVGRTLVTSLQRFSRIWQICGVRWCDAWMSW